MPVAAVVVAVNAGDKLASLKPFGPVQLYVGDPMPLTPAALNVTDEPTHSRFGNALTLVIIGNAFTVTVVVVAVALVQPPPGYVTVKLYTPLAAVVVVVNTGDMLASLKLFGPDQL